MAKSVERTFRRVTTRFGQLPLLILVIILFAITAFGVSHGSFEDRDMKMALDIFDIHAYAYNASQYHTFSDIQYPANFANIILRWPAATILMCAALFLSYLLGSIIKLCYFKQRPEAKTYKNILQKIDASSFPSIHTANSFIVAFFGVYSCLMYGTRFSGASFWLLFFIVISLSRIALKKHYPGDVLGGVIFAIGILTLIAAFYDPIITLGTKIITVFL